jgi:TRAP transporter TAXI family solute receptor
MKKVFALVLALCLVFALCACGSPAAPAASAAPAPADTSSDAPADAAPADAAPAPVSASLTMGTGGEAGTYYAVGGVLGSYIGQKTDISINVVASNGSAANLVGIVNDQIYDLATVQSDVMTYAFNGTNSFADVGVLDGFRVLGGLYAETVQIVSVDPSIKSVTDLAGKNVCVGDVGSGTYFNTVDILAAYGMTLDDIVPTYESFNSSTESLRDGKIDAAFTTAGAPTPSIVDLATTNTVNLVSIDDEHLAKLLDACPWYAAYTIPAGTYKGQDDDAVTVTVKATLVCRADLPDDVAYAIVSTIFDNTGDIAALHAKGAEFSLDFATEGIAVPFAKGAAQYYAENGITVATDP